jgi:hypothetical protein
MKTKIPVADIHTFTIEEIWLFAILNGKFKIISIEVNHIYEILQFSKSSCS